MMAPRGGAMEKTDVNDAVRATLPSRDDHWWSQTLTSTSYCVYIATAESILLLFLQKELHGTNVNSMYQRREHAFIVSSRYPMPFYKDGTSPPMCMCESKQYQASAQLLHLKYLLHAAPVVRSALIPIAAVLLERPHLLVAFDINDLFEELWLV